MRNLPERPPSSTDAPGTLLFTSPERSPDGAARVRAFRHGAGHLLRLGPSGDFYVGPEPEIRWTGPATGGGADLASARMDFLGPVLALWLEARGHLVLHGAALAVDDTAFGLLARHGTGKSTLSLELMARGGAALLADDLIALDSRDGPAVRARSAYPEMRVWPDTLDRVGLDPSSLPRVHPDLDKRRLPVGEGGFGAFRAEPLPLSRLYVLQREDEQRPVRAEALGPSETLVELVRHSFLARLTDALGWQTERLSRLAEVARRVPVRRLVYPSGARGLAGARETLLADLAGEELSR